MYLPRTLCDVLDEMRKCYKTYHFAPIEGLIEEVQIMANRMEAKIETIHDYEHMCNDLKHMRNTRKQLQADLDKLREKE